MTLLIWLLRTVKFIKTGSRIVVITVLGVGGRNNGDLFFNGYKFSVWNDGEVVKMDGVDGCEPMWMYLIHWITQTKMVKMVTSILRIFPLCFKK